MSTWIVRAPTTGRGLRVGVKDLIDVAGLPTTAGCRAVAEQAAPAAADADCLTGLRAAIAAGTACFAGTTNLHELAYGITGINPAFGTPVNPLDAALVPGGSSSGSAVAVAAGEADVAFGSDTGGSIRIPAACCGVAGLKTTWGRIPLAGVRPLAPSMDTVGPMARDVAGLVAGMALLEPGFAPGVEPPVAVGRLRLPCDPRIDAAVDAALAAAGWAVSPVEPDGLDDALHAAMTILDAEAWASTGPLVERVAASVGPDVAARLRRAARIGADEIERARAGRRAWEAELDRIWAHVQLVAVPTLTGFPPRIEDAAGMAGIRSVNAAVNLAGVPAVAVPVPAGGPLPASLQLVGPPGSEELLLAAAAVVEAAAAR